MCRCDVASVCRFLPHMVTMFPHSGLFPAKFSLNGSNVLAMSSGDDVHTIDISYSCVSNHSVASLNVSLDSQGSAQLLRAIFITKTKCFRFYEKKI